jgi:hypothetical protein
MTFTLLTEEIYFSAEKNIVANIVDEDILALRMISTTRKEVETIISNVLKNTFDFDSFALMALPASPTTSARSKNSHLTNVVGLYLIINRRSNKFYLGSSIDLAQRRREYRSYISNNSKKLDKTMREDRVIGQASDFYFVPVVGFHRSNVTNVTGRRTSAAQPVGISTAPGSSSEARRTSLAQRSAQQETNKLLRTFLDLRVEQPLLTEYLNPKSQYASFFYNKKTIGSFVKGNKEGGSAQSGSPNRPLMFENYAWESVRAAANSLSKDRKSIRLQRDQDKFKEISIEEFQNFAGIRISNANASTFFQDRPEELLTIKRKLGLR